MNKENYRNIVRDGCSVEYKDISLSDLRNYFYWMKNKKRVYQVHSNKFTEVYESLDEAIDKFLELKGK